MNILDHTETHWCERTQDMSGYVLPDSTSSPSDEQLHSTYSTTHHDSDLLNSENPSPEEVNLEDQADTVCIEEDSNMYNSNYSLLNTKLKTWLPTISEIDEFVKTTADDKMRDFVPPLHSENSLLCVEPVKEDKKRLSISIKSTDLSRFKCEEPYIKEDFDSSSDCNTDRRKSMSREEIEVAAEQFFKEEMDVAAEEVVITEDDEDTNVYMCDIKTNIDLNTLWHFDAECMQPVTPKVEVVEDSKPSADELSLPISSFSMIEDCDPSLGIYATDQISSMLEYDEILQTPPVQRSMPPLRLDMEAAKMSVNELYGEALPDTPEVLKPVLKPDTGFDLVNFLLDGDSNNNAIIPSSSSKKLGTSRPQVQRRGKGSLRELKASQTSRKRSLPQTVVEDHQPSTSDALCERLSVETVSTPSPRFTTTGRPKRESTTRLNKRLEQAGYLTSMMDTNSVSSDDENSNQTIQSKRRRTLSSSTRSRLNSDSDHSVVCDSSRYRERRDKNNVSSKKSRQKRKQALEMKTLELNELEKENIRLKEKFTKLVAVCKILQETLFSSLRENKHNVN